MPVPVPIETEDGRRLLTPAFLRDRLAHLPPFGSPGELCLGLGLAGSGWNQLLAAGFHWPCTREEVIAWFTARGWMTD
jgi:hypothetical protein